MTSRVAVIGAGSWGTAVAATVARNAPTIIWARRKELAEEIAVEHLSRSYMPDVLLPEQLDATSSLEEAVTDASVIVMGVPSHGFRDVLIELAPFVASGVPVVSLSKGVEQTTLMRMTEVITEVLIGHPAGVLTGPNLAREVIAGYPAASVVAVDDDELACDLQQLFSTESFRVYTNPDVVGCEVGGALKNVIAIAAGMV